VVGIPNENASVGLSTDRPFEGKQCLKLHYHFTGAGQYLGVSNAVKIKMPVHKLRHATLPLCKSQPLFFMVDLATGGGWPVDLSRYDGRADMYVDYVRVYQQER
jgi:hypothetical protein